MNIFFLHRDPSRAAKAQCDKHVVKMVLETTQMLSTAARRNGCDRGYKSAHPNHPMTLWVGDNDSNFSWALEHAQALSKEYTARYSKLHACQKVINEFLSFRKGNFMHFSKPPQCMPDEFKQDDFVRAYRDYYIHKISQWKLPPKWFKNLDADPYYANV